jgi:hypothetical protein
LVNIIQMQNATKAIDMKQIWALATHDQSSKHYRTLSTSFYALSLSWWYTLRFEMNIHESTNAKAKTQARAVCLMHTVESRFGV